MPAKCSQPTTAATRKRFVRPSLARFEVGLWTNYLVVQMQRELAAAQEVELRAILDYQRALIEFDRAQRASPAPRNASPARRFGPSPPLQ